MTEVRNKRCVLRRTATAAPWMCVRAAVIAAVAVAAACDDESVVGPPPVAEPVALSPPALSAAPMSDRDILVALYEATDGPNWLNSENWLTDAPLGEWYGVETDASGRVVRLDLAGKWSNEEQRYVVHGLSGRLPAELGGLANLKNLYLSNNELSGTIPAELGGLTNLEWLNLWDNELSGTVPAALSSLVNLRGLDLWGNELSGTIPTELGELTNLERLYLSNNELSGTIPTELGELTNLERLYLGGNELSGTLPTELGGLANLRVLYLGGNELSGTLPTELGGLTNLEQLYLSSNELSGTVPLSFVELSQLRWFRFEENAGLCLPVDLVAWYEGIENREGPVCPDAEVLRALYEAAGGGGWTNADGWLGDGPLGEWYGVEVDTSGRVSAVDLEGNGLSGGLTNRLGDLAGLTTLRVGDNPDLAGRLPSSLRQTPLREFRYANTDLCAPSERSFQEWLSGLAQHEGTGLQCPPPSDREILTALYERTDGANWEESRNWLTDAPLGTWYGVETNAAGRVTSLVLSRNGLEGTIPPELGGLAELETLNLWGNNLTGPIPPDLGALSELEELALHRNRLTSVPPELGQLGNLRYLAVSFNQLESLPSELGGLAALEELWLCCNQLTSAPSELGRLGNLREFSLGLNRLASVPREIGRLAKLEYLNLGDNELTSIPPELGGLAELEYLGLWSNELTSVPRELGQLRNLEGLDLDENRLASLPPELGRLDSLGVLWLASNELTSIPAELNALNSLELLVLAENRLTAVPLRSGGFAALAVLNLSSNEFTSFPWELGDLGNLRLLDLSGNRLTDVPPGLGRATGAKRLASYSASDRQAFFAERWSERGDPWRVDPDGTLSSLSQSQDAYRSQEADKWGTIRARMGLGGNRSAGVRSRAGGFPNLEVLDLSSNELRGSVPAGLLELTEITSLSLAENTGMTGALPLQLTAFELLDDLHTTGTGLCAPPDPEFLDWLDGVTRQRVALCGRAASADAYLTQAVQAREFPVPLVAGEPALLRVFVTADGATGAGMPPVRATFYRDGAVTHVAEIPGTSDPVPAAIDESSLSKSANAEIPGRVIQPGLEIVIEPDPGGTLDPALDVPRRIPATGRMAVNVHAVPVFELTLVPFLWEESPDASILEVTAALADDPDGHELLEHTQLLLPVSAMDVKVHESVRTSTNNGFAILAQTEMIRVMEGGRGHYLGVMAPPTTPGGLGGVAYGIGSWSSFSILDSEIIAHELGHNRNLYHAPCGGAGGPDRYYPYGEGNIGAWGYDFRTGDLVPPGQPDLMSYCDPSWISDYQFTNALRYRLETESGSILVVAAAPPAAPARTLLLWGGLDSEGAPHLRPAFFIDALPTLPQASGPYSLTGEDPSGAELFSLSFAMAEFTDTEDDRAGFSFALPVTWTRELASITLRGPRGSASLDRDTDDPVTILRDPATGQIRGILDGPSPAATAPGPAAAPGQGFEVLFSRGIPSSR